MARKKDYKKLKDEDIVRLVDSNVKASVGYYDTQLSRERKQVAEYYNGSLPRPVHDGNSKYVSLDVYDQVESMKAALLETFSSGNKTVRFAPQNEDDVQKAKICTEYTDFVAHRQNSIYKVMSEIIHDGLTARAGICKVFWASQSEDEPKFFEGLTEDELDLLISQDGVSLVSQEEDESGMISGSITVTRDTSQVIVETVAPEEFLIEAGAVSLDTVQFVAHRTKKTLSELRAMGYKESLLSKIGTHADVDMETDPEFLARHESINEVGFNAEGYQDQVRKVLVYEAYIHLDIEATGEAKLWRVLKAGNALLEKSEVSRLPFVAFVPLPVPHVFFGTNFGQKLIATQNARTVLMRSILDHAMITNNPRYTIVKGALPNPKELIDNRVGGVVNVTRPDAISPLVQAPLNPFVFQTLNVLQDKMESTTGVSSLSQGLNKDAVSKQNSAAMVEQLASMSQQRQKIIARNFANQFVKPLYHLIYQLVIENEDNTKIVELSGEYVEIDPSSWEDKRDITVELHLGYGEQEKESKKYMAVHQVLSQDPALQKMYSPENQYNLIAHVMEITGIKDVSNYLTNPAQIPPEQPDPMQELSMANLQKQMEIQERQTAVAEQKVQLEQQVQEMKLELEKLKARNSHSIASDSIDLKESEFEHKRLIDAAELILANRATPDNIKAIASPNG